MSDAKKPVNVTPTTLTATELYLKGREIEQREHAEAEVHKKGTLRGGSSGCLTDQGEVYGTCHRQALARFKGYQSEIEEISYTWFDAGYANEDAWMQKLTKSVEAMGPDFELKAEEECPIKWEVKDGVMVTGRPDIMIFEKGKPILGLELKVVCAVNSAVNLYCEDKPKINNLIQAAHYSMAHGCPFTLVYSFRNRSRVPGWAERYKDKLNLSYEKTFTSAKTGRSFTRREYTIEPFTKEFLVGFEDDRVYYIKENGERVDTPLTASGIRRYYELIVDMDKEKKLHTRITSKDLSGKLLPYDPCNYCPFKDACDDFENDYDSWLDKVRLICEEE
jgi:hypothetical protein